MPARHEPAALDPLSDTQLIRELEILVRDDRRLTARLLVHLAEVDARKLYLNHACSSMHVYCVDRLHMSDPQAYRRIHAARAARRFPRIFGMVARNELHLTGIALLSQFLTEANHGVLLDAAVHKSKKQLEQLIANRFPRPDAPDIPADIEPSAPERFKVQFTAGAALHSKLREAQALLRHQIPNGDIAEIFERALDLLLKDAKKKRFGLADRPRTAPAASAGPAKRHIANGIKRAVYDRDGGRCTFMDADGNRCQEISLIEFHHLDAFARGGAHTIENITLRCAPHNRFAAEQELGREVVAAKIEQARNARELRGAPPSESITPPSVSTTPPSMSITPPSESTTTSSESVTPPGEADSQSTGLLAPSEVREAHQPPHTSYAAKRRTAAPATAARGASGAGIGDGVIPGRTVPGTVGPSSHVGDRLAITVGEGRRHDVVLTDRRGLTEPDRTSSLTEHGRWFRRLEARGLEGCNVFLGYPY